MPDFLTNPLFWLYLAGWIPYTAFVLLYGFRSPWWVSVLGRSLLLSKCVIWLLLTHALLIVSMGPGYPGAGTIRAVLIGGVITAGWAQLSMLLREQTRDRKPEPCPAVTEESP